MKAKPLPDQAFLNACLHYDPLSGSLIWRVRPEWSFPIRAGRTLSHIANAWNAAWAGKPALNCQAKNRYLKGAIDGGEYYAHRIIWKMLYGTEPDDIDHEDGVRSNNAKNNLLDKSRANNLKNRCLSSNNTSGYHGVSYSNRHKLWVAGIYQNNKRIHLGWFKDKKDAINARKAAEKQYNYHPNHGRPT